MKSKYTIDRDTRTLVLKYVRKYAEYKTWLAEERQKILSLNPQDLFMLDMPKSSAVSDTTAYSAAGLEKLEQSHKAQVVNAIDSARRFLDTAALPFVWKSCLDSRTYNYDALKDDLPCSRSQFYRYKNVFMNDIRYYLDL